MGVGRGVVVADAVAVGLAVGVAVAVAVGVAVEKVVGVAVAAPLAALSAMSWVRLEAARVSSLPLPTAVSPAVLFSDWDIWAVLPRLEAVFFKS